jgi:hypothetical protein
MLDLVLGYNAHPDPAGSALEAIKEAKALLKKMGATSALLQQFAAPMKISRNAVNRLIS